MTRIVSKLGIAAALTLGMLSTAAAQGTTTKKKPVAKPTTVVPVTKEAPGEVVRIDTVTVYKRDTVTVWKRDTLRLTGPTITRYDTTTVVRVPGWLDRAHGAYFGLGAGPYYPSAGIGGGQIPGYAFQANLGIDPAGSPLGVRLTGGIARPDESAAPSFNGIEGGRPTVANFTADLKFRVPFFSGTRFPMFSLYAVGGGAAVMYKDLRLETETVKNIQLTGTGTQHAFGYDWGAGATMQLGHMREMFLEGRVINFYKTGYESNHQVPIILGVNWY
jgi:opacity protein-like surface antigen